MTSRGALLRALLGALLVACRRDATEATSTSTMSTTPVVASSVAPPASVPPVKSGPGQSTWTKPSNEPFDLVVAPDRAAWVAFEPAGGGYVIHRGDRAQRLPRDWFGAGPPRRDISISDDGARLAVPLREPAQGEGAAAIVYDTAATRFLGRFAVPKGDAPDAGAGEVKVSGDGKHVVWTFGRVCMRSEIATGTLVKACP